MDDQKRIYQQQAEDYHRLVSYEDHQGNLLPAIHRIRPLDGLNVIELGAGTGRLTRLLRPHVRSIQAFDLSPHMLEKAASVLKKDDVSLPGKPSLEMDKARMQNWGLAAADNRRLPVKDGWADLAISGWSLCYLVAWGDANWQPQVVQALSEMRRVLHTDGVMVILETLGTGYEAPNPPGHLVDYYAFLEKAGFQSTWMRTDYRFPSLAEGKRLTSFFFGEELAKRVVEERGNLPECTGVWWRGCDQ